MSAERPRPAGSSSARPLVLIVLGLGSLAILVFAPWKSWLVTGLTYSRALGPVGVLAFVALYALASVLLLPGSVLTLAAGFSWGLGWGTLIAWVAANLASNLSFVVGRFLARDWVAQRARRMPRFAAIDRAIGHSGLRLVLLLRLSPVVPFNLLNYALGITQVRFRDYALGGALGMIPGTLLYVYLGCSLHSLSQLVVGGRPSGGVAQAALFWGGLLATVLSVVLVTRAAQKELRRELTVSDESDP